MLVGFKKTVKSVRLDIKTNCKLVMIKLTLVNIIPVILGAFYHPLSSPPCMGEIYNSSLEIPNLHRYDLLLCGDFNLPDIDWSKDCLNQNPSHPSESILLIDTRADFGLSQ